MWAKTPAGRCRRVRCPAEHVCASRWAQRAGSLPTAICLLCLLACSRLQWPSANGCVPTIRRRSPSIWEACWVPEFLGTFDYLLEGHSLCPPSSPVPRSRHPSVFPFFPTPTAPRNLAGMKVVDDLPLTLPRVSSLSRYSKYVRLWELRWRTREGTRTRKRATPLLG